MKKKLEIDYYHTNKKTRDQNEQVGNVWKSRAVNYEFNTLTGEQLKTMAKLHKLEIQGLELSW